MAFSHCLNHWDVYSYLRPTKPGRSMYMLGSFHKIYLSLGNLTFFILFHPPVPPVPRWNPQKWLVKKIPPTKTPLPKIPVKDVKFHQQFYVSVHSRTSNSGGWVSLGAHLPRYLPAGILPMGQLGQADIGSICRLHRCQSEEIQPQSREFVTLTQPLDWPYGWGISGKMGGFPQQSWVFLLKMISTWGGDWGNPPFFRKHPYIHNIPYQYHYHNHYHYHHLGISYLTLPYSTWHRLHIGVLPLTATVTIINITCSVGDPY